MLHGEMNNTVCMYFHDSSFYTEEKIRKGINELVEWGVELCIENIWVLLNDGSNILKIRV